MAIGACYTLAAFWQLGVMRSQYTEMTIARKQSRKDNAATITAQKEIAESSLAGQERAWVGARVELIQSTEGDTVDTVNYQVVLRNAGLSPALRVKVEPGYIVLPRDYVLDSDFASTNKIVENPQNKKGSLPVILQGEHIYTPTFPSIFPHTPRKQGVRTQWLYLAGDIIYDDAFGNHRSTSYCVRVERQNLAVCNTHNDMR